MNFIKTINIYKILLDFHYLIEYDRYNVDRDTEREFNKFQYKVAVKLYDNYIQPKDTKTDDQKVLYMFKNTNVFDLLRKIGDQIPRNFIFKLNNSDVDKYSNYLFQRISVN